MGSQQQETGVHPAVKHDRWIKARAAYLTRYARSISDDVAQEMRFFMCLHPEYDEGLLKVGAKNYAINYLLSKRNCHSWASKVEHLSLNALSKDFDSYLVYEPGFDLTSYDIRMILADCTPFERKLLYHWFWLKLSQIREAEILGFHWTTIAKYRRQLISELKQRYAGKEL